MLLRELLEGVEIVKICADPDTQIDSVCYDSRRVCAGSAFVAAKRIGADGHDFIDNAIEEGAEVIVSEKELPGVPFIQVVDGNRALAVMSANLYGNPARKMKLIGVTGTKGKTTTSFFIKSVIEKTTGKKVGLIGTIQNMIGNVTQASRNSTPEAVELHSLLRQMYDGGCEYVVMEVSSHSLAIDRVYGLEFEIAIFTNFSQDHLDYHKTMESYLDSKMKLFAMCKLGIVNIDDEASEHVMSSGTCEFATYGIESNDADLQAKNIRFLEDQGCSFEALTYDSIERIYLSTPGIFTVYNALAAAICCLKLGINLTDIASALRKTEPVRGRVEIIPTGTKYKVIVDYAHSPSSVESVITAVRSFTKGRIISLIGCGGNRDKTKRPIMALAATSGSEHVIFTTDNPRSEQPEDIIKDMIEGLDSSKASYEVIVDRRTAIHRALDLAREGDTVLIMGKGHETYQEINGERIHFDDREEILLYYVDTDGKKKLD